MVIEHDFITKVADEAALACYRRTAEQLGFEAIDADGTRYRRALREKSRLDRLNSDIGIHMTVDRGRVSIGVRLDTPDRTGPFHEALCRTLVLLFESVMAGGASLDDARGEWDAQISAFRQPIRVTPLQIILLIALAGLFAFIYIKARTEIGV
ncbi:MAG TPA: hypothetical protein P5081_16500 [Phycisphaerae bacterium]|nr:hypothetical protein [Phycisphaerae bacterium]HRW54472.1 hypothetical protein [Phycisphaerae bacterium]